MLEHELIQSVGVANVTQDGEVTGFTFKLRMPNYRGLWGSLIDGVDVSVDGDTWDREQPTWTLQGKTFTIQELRQSQTEVRWQLDELATITVPHPGGLSVGVHNLAVDIALHAPYIPAEYQPSVFHAARKVTVVA